MKKFVKHLTILGVLVLALAFVTACRGDNEPAATPPPEEQPAATPTPAPADPAQTEPVDIPQVEGLPIGMDPASLELPRLERPERFTFRDQNSFPEHWNPHNRMGTNIQVTMHRDFLSLRFTKIASPDNGATFELINVAATNHTDITASFTEHERFGIPEDATSGHVFTIDIRQDLRWNDGTPIDAHSWVAAKQLALDPEMVNPIASGMVNSTAGALAYFEGEGEWEDVGFWASGDYQITWVLINWTNMFDFRYNFHGDWLVHYDMYTAGFSWEEDLKVTNYNTTIETSRFAGPFQLIVAELDRQLVFERNPYWFGWTDPAWDDFYMMTDIIIDVIPEVATRMMLFNQGLLDRITVGGDDFETYRFSDHLVQWETTNMARFVFNTDLEMLRNLEEYMGDGFNRQVLSIRTFRQAMSFAIDRHRFASQATAGRAPSVVLMMNYYYDFSNNPDSLFRNNEHAQRAFVEFYGLSYGPGTPFPTVGDAFDAITGFNLHRARELFQEAYEYAVENGLYTSGQEINIQMVASAAALTPMLMRQEELLSEMLAEATIGTGFEGNLTLTFLGNFAGANDALMDGRVEARTAGWGGAMFSPVGLMAVYTNSVSMGGVRGINESAGWDPTVETFSLTYDFGNGVETRTKTFEDWHMSISGVGEFVGEDPVIQDIRLFILANLEVQVVGTFQAIPHSVEVNSTLVSMKINFNPGYYHPMFDDLPGPRSQISFNFTDEAWAAFVAEQGGTLNYE